ncbi:hypothetical protein QBC47DRAFT_426546 [Echria macrotheca]|uniref:Enoyl reductase (ER) domain-containing protein n=1 Tax=Echria macrotheca TaxID=438768 RepID=A0AAJ0B1G7_9PEZI|nr:hypothetical protein QBC47DRAFT_426546 [Echria macrotheca]
MRAWRYTSTSPTLESNLVLVDNLPLPTLPPSPSEPTLLIRVISASLNPVDYKLPSFPLIGRFIIPRPATPGGDFCGEVVQLSPEGTTRQNAKFKTGDLVFGRLDAPRQGSLGEYMVAPASACAKVPESVEVDAAAAVPTAGLAEYKVLVSGGITEGDRVFINGGIGGTGTLGVQIARAMGCHVTATCPGEKSELCRTLGADVVIDYVKEDVVRALEKEGKVFKMVVDNVGRSERLYAASGRFLVEGGVFVQVGMPSIWRAMLAMIKRTMLPRFMGGGVTKFHLFLIKGGEGLDKLGEMMVEGKLTPHVEKVYEFEQVPEAVAKLREGQCEGKLVVHVGNRD